jgi:hypothetical protein
MSVTSCRVGRGSLLEIQNSDDYAVGLETLEALLAGPPSEMRLTKMAGRAPAYGGSTPSERSIPLLVFMLASNAPTRKTAYDALAAALVCTLGLVTIEWTDDGVTKRYRCHVADLQPSLWFSRAAATLTAPNPVAEVV